ncbi:MAG: PKD domain-containing protein [Cryomorphaceae bacterium]
MNVARILIFTFGLLCLSAQAQAQGNEYDHWAFGSGVHMDFTGGGTPVVSCTLAINSSEASAVWSHPSTGDFIAYTNGATVYNGQNNNILANGTGLTANASSIESALILPKPGYSMDHFYIFHNNIFNTYWSEADMSIGTNGTVTSKNNFLQATGTERCGTAPHGSICPAYWLMISKATNDSVAAYLIDTGGISSTPVVTSTGITGGNARGNIVFSEDFTKMAMSVENVGMFVCDFNDTSGVTSNWTQIGTVTNGFGSAFSPDGTKLYYTSGYGQYLYQYNFSNSTQTLLGGPGLSYLALAPDGKIYISKYGQNTLGVINAPNLAGTTSNFQISGFTISTNTTCVCRWGLPNPFHVNIGTHPSEPDSIFLCTGEDTLFTTQIQGESYLWNTGDTTQSIFLDSGGLYYCTIGMGDCSSSDSVFVEYVDEVSISATTGCLGDTTFFTYNTQMPPSSIASYTWDFGDGSTSSQASPGHMYSAGNTYSVTLEIETNTGCILDTFVSAIVHPNPDPSFSVGNECDGNAVQFIDNSAAAGPPIVSKNWDVNTDGSIDYTSSNPDHIYPGHGTYTATFYVVDALGCDDSLSKDVFVHAVPNADFEVDPVCFNEVHAFGDSSTIALGDIVNWVWSFGDGNTSTLQHPSYEFSTPGSHNVTLLVTSDSGCSDEITLNTLAYHLPTLGFSFDSICLNETAVFSPSSTSQSGTILQYMWDLGDGTTTTVQSPNHAYATAGLYTVAHSVITNFGCTDTLSQNIRVYPIPHTAFGWTNNVCEGEDLPFTDQSSIANVTPGGDEIVSWVWEIDSDTFSLQPDPVYTSSQYGSIHIRLTTTSNYGCTTFDENDAFIFPIPKASFIAEPACQHDTTVFKDLSKIDLGLVNQWNWSFGDDSTSTEQFPQHVYTSPGTYVVTLTIASNKGCRDTTKRSLTIFESPVVDYEISPLSGCTDLEVRVVDKSSIGVGSLSSEWFVRGESVSKFKEASVVLENDTTLPVRYRFYLTSTSDQGCKVSVMLSDTVTVFPRPKAKFDILTNGYGMYDPTVEFDNRTNGAFKYLWTFGDGDSSKQFQPMHYYKRHGTYPVSMWAWNEYACPDSLEKILVFDPVTTIYVPNTFTPNGDGDNDVWMAKGFNEDQPFNVQVWDRWGNTIFESNAMELGWDGKVNGVRKASTGSYSYYIKFTASDGEVRELYGMVNLIR